MSKAVLISIKPKWCERIVSGEKTIEVRKTAPKLEPPFKCYIYCTKSRDRFIHGGLGESLDDFYRLHGKVIGEFACDRTLGFNLGGLELFGMKEEILKASCLTEKEVKKYLGLEAGYGLYISDLKIYDKPKELSEFEINRPPQSWCYVEELAVWL